MTVVDSFAVCSRSSDSETRPSAIMPGQRSTSAALSGVAAGSSRRMISPSFFSSSSAVMLSACARGPVAVVENDRRQSTLPRESRAVIASRRPGSSMRSSSATRNWMSR